MSSQILPSAGFILIRDKNTNKIGDFDMISDEKERESMIGEVIEIGEAVKLKLDKLGLSFLRLGLKDLQSMKIQKNLKKGDTIIYPKYHSSSFTWEGEELKIVQFSDVLGVIDEK